MVQDLLRSEDCYKVRYVEPQEGANSSVFSRCAVLRDVIM
jgi:hypothetical protein